MNKPINVLIVDDHPFIIEAYKNAINKYSQQGYEFTISQAGDCKKGYELITDETKVSKWQCLTSACQNMLKKEFTLAKIWLN